ncbi:MAG: phosphatase PAP2 family protein [Halobacteria archaeon]
MSRSVGVTEAVQGVVPDFAVPGFELITYFGQPAFFLLLFASYYYVNPGRKGLFYITVGGLSLTLLTVLKNLFGLPRPPIEMMRISQDGFGFPSGHAFGSTVAWFTLARISSVWTPRKRFGAAAVATVLVSASRLVLGVHYFVDILAGIAAGAGIYYLVVEVYDRNPETTTTTALIAALAGLLIIGLTDRYSLIFGCVAALSLYVYLNFNRVPRADMKSFVGVEDIDRSYYEKSLTFVLGGLLLISVAGLSRAVHSPEVIAVIAFITTYVLLSMPRVAARIYSRVR